MLTVPCNVSPRVLSSRVLLPCAVRFTCCFGVTGLGGVGWANWLAAFGLVPGVSHGA